MIRRGACLLLAMYFATVVCPTSIPSLSSSPCIRGTCLIFFVAEGRLPSCQSTPLARRVQANRPPPLRMRSLWTGSLLAPRDFLRRPPSVGTCPPVMTYKANTGRTRPFHFSLVRRQEKAPTGPGLQGNDQQSPPRRHRGGSENLRCALSALPSIRFRLIYGSREGAYSRNTSPLQRVHHPSRSNVAEPLNNKQKPAGSRLARNGRIIRMAELPKRDNASRAILPKPAVVRGVRVSDPPHAWTGPPVSRALNSVLIKNGIAISMDGKGAWRDNVFVERSLARHTCGKFFLLMRRITTMSHTAYLSMSLIPKKLDCRYFSPVGCDRRLRTRSTRHLVSSRSRIARLKSQGPSASGWVASISPRSAAIRNVFGLMPSRAAACVRFIHPSASQVSDR
jgi:hypothetical protein